MRGGTPYVSGKLESKLVSRQAARWISTGDPDLGQKSAPDAPQAETNGYPHARSAKATP
jgi:hypothetical protein